MNIAGKYESNHGDVVITQTGNKITVAYQKAGTCKAELEGNVVRGQWNNFGQSGLFEWTFDDKGSFTGKFKKGTDQGAMKGTWSGKKIAETASTAGIQVKTKAIETDSNKNDAAIKIAKIDGKAEDEGETTQAASAASAANHEPQPVSATATIPVESVKPKPEKPARLTAEEKMEARLEIQEKILDLQERIQEYKNDIKEETTEYNNDVKYWEKVKKKAKYPSRELEEAKDRLIALGILGKSRLNNSVNYYKEKIHEEQLKIERLKEEMKMIK